MEKEDHCDDNGDEITIITQEEDREELEEESNYEYHEVTEEEFTYGASHLPQRQLDLYYKAMKLMAPHMTYTDDHIRIVIMGIISTNPICSNCLKKDRETLLKLTLCQECKTEWYCDEVCKSDHLHIHSKYCQDTQGEWPLDSPFRPLYVNRETNEDML